MNYKINYKTGDIIVCIKKQENFLCAGILYECVHAEESYIVSFVGYDDYLNKYVILKGKEFKYDYDNFVTLLQYRQFKINRLKKKSKKKNFLNGQ